MMSSLDGHNYNCYGLVHTHTLTYLLYPTRCLRVSDARCIDRGSRLAKGGKTRVGNDEKMTG